LPGQVALAGSHQIPSHASEHITKYTLAIAKDGKLVLKTMFLGL